MIKHISDGKTVTDRNEILSDRDIVISYSPIDIGSGIKIQINNLQVKENEANLFVKIDRQEFTDDMDTFKMKVTNQSNEELANKDIKNKEKPVYDEIIKLNNFKEDTKVLNLSISLNGKELSKLKVNLETREIEVDQDQAFKKISEIELKKYLSEFAILDYVKDVDDKDTQRDYTIIVANKIAYNVLGINELDREATNELVDSFYKNFAEKETVNGKEVLKTGKGYKYSEKADEYKALTEGSEVPDGKCIRVDDISYSEGTYKIKYIYMITTLPATESIESFYESTIELKLDENSKYSKYQIVKLGNAKQIEDSSNIKDPMSDNPESSKYNPNLKADENGKIALTTLGMDVFKTEKKNGYYVYVDPFDNRYEFTTIRKINSEFRFLSNGGNSALFECYVTYSTVDEKQDMFSVAVTIDSEFKNPRLLGTYDNYTGTTSFVRNFTDLYERTEPIDTPTENCEHKFEAERVSIYTLPTHLLTLDGNHICTCVKCGESKYEKHHFGKWFSIENNTAWTLWCDDCKGYVYTKDYNVVKNSGYDLIESEEKNCDHNYECHITEPQHAELNGTHTLICTNCGDTKEEKHHFGKWFSLYNDTAWSLWCEDCKQYVFTQDFNVVKNSGYDLRDESDTN